MEVYGSKPTDMTYRNLSIFSNQINVKGIDVLELCGMDAEGCPSLEC